MKRIGTMESGGILVEMTPLDIIHLVQAKEIISFFSTALEGQIITAAPIPVNAPESAKPLLKMAEKPGNLRKCEKCGKPFAPKSDKSRYCSRVCQNKAYRATKTTSNPAKPTIKCQTCGKTFTQWRKDQTCCSISCRNRTTYPKFDAAAAKAERLAKIKAIAEKRGTFRPVQETVPREFVQAQREANQE